MKQDKTPQNGYYRLKTDDSELMLHFSMNAWYDLKERTGMDIAEYSVALEKGTDFDKAISLSEIIFSAIKAYSLEENEEIDVTIYKIRGWLGTIIGPKEIEDITKALMWNNSSVKKDAKKK